MQMQPIIDRFLRSEKSRLLGLKPLDKLLMFFLASYMADKDYCFPSYSDLMADLAIGKRSDLRKSLNRLCSAQILFIDRPCHQSNIYRFNLALITDVIY